MFKAICTGLQAQQMSREKVVELDQRKQRIEQQIEQIVAYLTAPGMPGIKGPLVDLEGFPLPGIDHYRIRQMRQRHNILNTDYSNIMKEIQQELESYFSEVPANQESKLIENRTAVEVEVPIKPVIRAFAVITEVSPNSPAFQAGIQINDKIIRFGSVDYINNQNLQNLAALVSQNENQEVNILVLRKNAINQEFESTLKITPKKWTGQGLLGCRFKPI